MLKLILLPLQMGDAQSTSHDSHGHEEGNHAPYAAQISAEDMYDVLLAITEWKEPADSI